MLCLCGCGEETGTSNRTISARNIKKGDPLRFRPGHAGGAARRRFLVTPDMWSEMDLGHDSPCWILRRTSKNKWGHCSVWLGGKEYSAHRRMYEQEVGPIPEGLELDHLCHQPSCVRPDHLEAVTHAVNIRRSRLAKLTQEQVDYIRSTPLAPKELSEELGISRKTVHDIRSGRSWTAI